MATLDLKLFREIKRLRAQVLAIALVVAGGVAAIVLSVGSFRSLEETRNAYYERYAFADVFATAKRAPKSLARQLAAIPGVAAVDVRIAQLALLDIPNFMEPATGQFASLPEIGEPNLNRVTLRTGRLPEPTRTDEVAVNESFANAHGFTLGSRFAAILNGRKQELVVVGTVLSPEFIYAIGPGDRSPDDRRFGIIWMPEKALASAYDLDGAFSSVSLKLLPGASEREVIKRVDALLDPYGGAAAYGRKDQTSHAWSDHGLDMLKNMARTLPPIFLLVAAFLVNLTLSRLVALEREEIGLLKSMGYSNAVIAGHYTKLIAIIVLIGVVVGSAIGAWAGIRVTGLFREIMRFPFLVFVQSPDLYLAAAGVSFLAAMIGAGQALRDVVRLPPAVAMQPPVPPRYHHLLPERFAAKKHLSQPGTMTLRNIVHHPVRTALTVVGIALATGILIVSLFMKDTVEQLIDVTYFMADRQDATISFVEKRPRDVTMQIARLPGVLAVEANRQVPIRIRHETFERRVTLSGKPSDAELSRIIDMDLRHVVLPEAGLAISRYLARILHVQQGDTVEVDLLDGERRTVVLPVVALVEDYFGIQAMMDYDALSRLMREAPVINSANISVDSSKLDGLYKAIKEMPVVSGMGSQRASLAMFRETSAVILTTMSIIYTALAAIIAFGIVYNSARISLSERARELASLRVLGFTEGEVLRILLLDLGLLTLLAQAPGWAIGFGLAWLMRLQLAGELMRAPLTVQNLTYVLASGIVVVAALLSGLVVRRRVNRLDLVAVLKTRD